MPDLPSDLLSRPAEAAARVLALNRLDGAAAALERCVERDDPEALHDFRVALRRLRSLVRAYRPYVSSSVRKSLRRRLKTIADATNAGRDAEVLLDWLRVQHESLTVRERVGWRWLVTRVERREQEASHGLEGLAGRFAKAERRLRRRLGKYQLTVELDGAATPSGPSFGEATATAVRALADELAERFADGPASDDPEAVHAARICAKRLRYLLEPVAEAVDGAATLERLRGLQDLLGELNDAHVAARTLGRAVEAAAAARARAEFDAAVTDGADRATAPRPRDERSGLIALARLAHARWQRAFERLEKEWLGAAGAPLFRELHDLAERLALATSTRPPDAGASADGAGRWSAAARGARRPARRAARET